MAIKNTNLGGVDWVDGAILTHTDLNDTFDEAYENDKYSNIYSDHNYIVSGLDVTEDGTPSKTVNVSAGVYVNGGKHKQLSATTATLSDADITNPRWDLLTINSSGTIVVTDGTAGTSPTHPSIPANSTPLALIFRYANDNTITNSDIVKYWNIPEIYGGLLYEYNGSLQTSENQNPTTIPFVSGTKHLKYKFLNCELNGSSSTAIYMYINKVDSNTRHSYIYMQTGSAPYTSESSSTSSILLIRHGNSGSEMGFSGEYNIDYSDGTSNDYILFSGYGAIAFTSVSQKNILYFGRYSVDTGESDIKFTRINGFSSSYAFKLRYKVYKVS